MHRAREYPSTTNIPTERGVNGYVTTAAADSVPAKTQGMGYSVAKVNTGRIKVTTEFTWDKVISVVAMAVTAAGAARLAQFKLGSEDPATRSFEIMTTDASGTLAHLAAGDGFMFQAKLQNNRGPSV